MSSLTPSRVTWLFSRELTIPLATSLVALAAWEALVHAGFLRAAFFPPPTNIVSTLLGLAAGGELWLHAGTTLGRLIASFLMALIPGTALGIAMGWWMGMRTAADPLVRLLFPIPSIAFFPVVLFFFGLSEWRVPWWRQAGIMGGGAGGYLCELSCRRRCRVSLSGIASLWESDSSSPWPSKWWRPNTGWGVFFGFV